MRVRALRVGEGGAQVSHEGEEEGREAECGTHLGLYP